MHEYKAQMSYCVLDTLVGYSVWLVNLEGLADSKSEAVTKVVAFTYSAAGTFAVQSESEVFPRNCNTEMDSECAVGGSLHQTAEITG